MDDIVFIILFAILFVGVAFAVIFFGLRIGRKQRKIYKKVMELGQDSIGVFLGSQIRSGSPEDPEASCNVTFGFKDSSGTVREGKTGFGLLLIHRDILQRLQVFPVKYLVDKAIVPQLVYSEHNKVNAQRKVSPVAGPFFKSQKVINPFFAPEEIRIHILEISPSSASESDLITLITQLFSSCQNEHEMQNILNEYRPKLSQDAQDFLHDQIKEVLTQK